MQSDLELFELQKDIWNLIRDLKQLKVKRYSYEACRETMKGTLVQRLFGKHKYFEPRFNEELKNWYKKERTVFEIPFNKLIDILVKLSNDVERENDERCIPIDEENRRVIDA